MVFPEEEQKKKVNISLFYIIMRSCFALAFCLFSLLLLSFFLLQLAVLNGNMWIWNPISLPSQCKIVSSSVDLRSSKVCELGLLNYKAKYVLYPFASKKYRCHYDYYWASVLKIEYIDHSGQARPAVAEAPNEALPSNCRPNFGAAWLAKDKFKVNETYECWYTLGSSKVNINLDGLFDCQAKELSTVEMLRWYSVVFTSLLKLRFGGTSIGLWRWDAIAGVATGFSTSLISVTLVGFLRPLMSFICRLCAVKKLPHSPSAILLK